ncbi:MAG TPA: hypothetical protein VMM77_04950 [Gemmatimonadaceae bacterium]|nr:hypothetical protein [Gemmatimonadaceae bacterium]
MSSRQPVTPLILLVLLSLTVGVLAESRAQRSTLRSLGESDGRPLVAYLLVRADDCESHHELLQQLQRPSIARTTENGGALLIGTSVAARKAAATLTREMPSVRARRASMLERRLLWRLGFRQTPVLLLLNASTGSVRFSARAPLTIRDRVRLLRMLSTVTAE